jgi:hypothetical protein
MRSQAGIAFGGNQLNRTETSKTAFVAMKGLEFSEMICDEMGAHSAFVSSAPKYYADARKRADCEAGVHLRADDSLPLCDRDPKIVRDYQACIRSLMYLGVFTRGDCAFGINQCARFLNNPGPSHVAAAKRKLKYIAGT